MHQEAKFVCTLSLAVNALHGHMVLLDKPKSLLQYTELEVEEVFLHNAIIHAALGHQLSVYMAPLFTDGPLSLQHALLHTCIRPSCKHVGKNINIFTSIMCIHFMDCQARAAVHQIPKLQFWCAQYCVVPVASVTDVGKTSRNICNSTAKVHQRMINIVRGHGMSCYMFASSAKLCWCDSLYQCHVVMHCMIYMLCKFACAHCIWCHIFGMKGQLSDLYQLAMSIKALSLSHKCMF